MGTWKARLVFTPVTRGSELWDKVDEYKENLNFVAVNKEEAAKWEVAKKEEAQGLVEYFTNGDGKNEVAMLSSEDGR